MEAGQRVTADSSPTYLPRRCGRIQDTLLSFFILFGETRLGEKQLSSEHT
jgi:hypothetical protein